VCRGVLADCIHRQALCAKINAFRLRAAAALCCPCITVRGHNRLLGEQWLDLDPLEEATLLVPWLGAAERWTAHVALDDGATLCRNPTLAQRCALHCQLSNLALPAAAAATWPRHGDYGRRTFEGLWNIIA